MSEERHTTWQPQPQGDVESLIAALSFSDAEIRRRASMTLRALNATQAVPALRQALERETVPQVRVSLQLAIQALDDSVDILALARAHDIAGLVTVLKGRHQEQSIAAAYALGELGDRLAIEPLIIRFHDVSAPPPVRLAAAEALLVLKGAPAVVTLLGALRRDSWQVRRNAAAVLGQIQAVWAVEPLAETVSNDSNPVVQRTAEAALRRIGTPEALSALERASKPQPAASLQPFRPAASTAVKPVPNDVTIELPAKALTGNIAAMLGHTLKPKTGPLPAKLDAPTKARTEPVAAKPDAALPPMKSSEPVVDSPPKTPAVIESPPLAASPSSMGASPAPPPTSPPAPEDDRRDTLLMRPVNRLISFFKSRD